MNVTRWLQVLGVEHRPCHDDRTLVVAAAESLGTTEFELFGAAYRAWYDDTPCEKTLERHFVPYMFEGVAPFWVRHFTRSALDSPTESVLFA